MAPPVEAFHASELPERVQITVQGRRQKKAVDLGKCELLEMVQYSCHLEGGEKGQQPDIKCASIVRAFRRCGDGCMVETTAWESRKM